MGRRAIVTIAGTLAFVALPWLGLLAQEELPPPTMSDKAQRLPDVVLGVVPVWQMPTVTPIDASGRGCGCKDGAGEVCVPPSRICKLTPINQFFFEKPAHFPLPRFDAEGIPVEVEGAMIYEGMSLILYTNGVFETHFVVTTLAHPVTLRLSFFVQPPHDSDCQPFQLTIPPVLIQTNAVQEGKANHHHWRVQYVGYSPFLANSASQTTNTVTRRGVARFGFEPGQQPSIYRY